MTSRIRPGLRWAAGGLVALGIAFGVSSWRAAAEKVSAGSAAQPSIDHRRNIGMAAVGDRGATYHKLEQRAVRTTTKFADVTAVAERRPGGAIRTRLTAADGHDVATLAIDSGLMFAASGAPRGFEPHPTVKSTLGWANRQVHALWRDAASSGEVEWRDDLLRGVAGQMRIDEPLEVHTESAGGFLASARRQAAGMPVTGEVFVSQITRNGQLVGSSTWFVRDQVFVFSFPGLTEGSLTRKDLSIVGGEWPFQPDLDWINTQNLAFYEFHQQLREQSRIAARRSVLERLAALFVVPLSAQNGCDGLHWLDNTIVRPCCDIHDQCYYAMGCSANSWWWGSAWPYGWQCLACNGFAIGCFGYSAIKVPFTNYPY